LPDSVGNARPAEGEAVGKQVQLIILIMVLFLTAGAGRSALAQGLSPQESWVIERAAAGQVADLWLIRPEASYGGAPGGSPAQPGMQSSGVPPGRPYGSHTAFIKYYLFDGNLV